MDKNVRLWVIVTSGVLALAVTGSAAADNTRTKITNKDDDPDRAVTTQHTSTPRHYAPNAVSTTRTTSYVPNENERHDVVESRAEERRQVEGRSFTLAPLIGYTTNNYGFSAGARFGYTFDTPVYVGGNFMVMSGENGTPTSMFPSAELGYDLGVGPVLFRPYGGLGVHFFSNTIDGASSRALLYPGLAMHYLVPRSPVFVGADGKVLFPIDRTAALSVTGTAGVNF